jgi:HK97 gp10 family phage protein
MASTKDYFDFKLEGSKELDRVLKGLPKAVGRRMIIAGLRDQAKPILRDARRHAPVDSGDSKKSIKIRTMVKSKFPAITIGPDTDHWFLKFAEYGSTRQTAKPFMRPAWDAHKRAAANGFIVSTIQAIEKYADRLKKQAYAGKLSRAGRKALGI